MAIVADIGDDAGKRCADRGLDSGNDGLELVAVIGRSGQRLDVADELAALGALQRGGDCIRPRAHAARRPGDLNLHVSVCKGPATKKQFLNAR